MYQPKLMIGIGQNNHFFTLRETYLHYIPGPGPFGNSVLNGVYQGTTVVRSHHLFNLSQSPEEAIEKAREHAKMIGMPLVSVDSVALRGQLDEIVRATAEQQEARRVADAEQAAKWAAQRAEYDRKWNEINGDLIRYGYFPLILRRYAACPFEEADVGYLSWLMDNVETFEAGSVIHAVAEKLLAEYSHLRLPKADLSKLVGKVGERREFEVTVIRVMQFDGMWGPVALVTMVDAEGACIMAKGGWAADVGTKLKIKATVKAHDEYKGQAQTVVNRVKAV